LHVFEITIGYVDFVVLDFVLFIYIDFRWPFCGLPTASPGVKRNELQIWRPAENTVRQISCGRATTTWRWWLGDAVYHR